MFEFPLNTVVPSSPVLNWFDAGKRIPEEKHKILFDIDHRHAIYTSY